MRERDEIEDNADTLYDELAANNLIQFVEGDELRGRKFANRNDETWPQNFEFFIHPRRAITNLLRIRNAISAPGSFARKASTNSREVNVAAQEGFIHSAKFFEPTEECFAG